MARTTASHTGSGGVVIDGIDALVRDLTLEVAEVKGRAEKITVRHAGLAAQKMRDLVAIDQGDVLDSITADEHATSDGLGVYADAGPDPSANKAAFVARFLEHGTVKMPPQPFMEPAGDQTIPGFLKDMNGASKL